MASDAARTAFTVPSQFREMDGVTALVHAFVAAHVPDEELGYRVELVASEAITNAIEHGNRLDASKSVHVRLGSGPDGVTIEVEDEGDGFDPGAVPDPIAEKALMAEGGRGLFLMKELADEIRYEHDGRCVVLALRPR